MGLKITQKFMVKYYDSSSLVFSHCLDARHYFGHFYHLYVKAWVNFVFNRSKRHFSEFRKSMAVAIYIYIYRTDKRLR